MDMDIPPVETNFLLKPIKIDDEEDFLVGIKRFRRARASERSKFHYDNLRPGQQEIYKYVRDHPNNIVVVEGYPESGKTFTLRAIAHAWEKPVNVIIYQKDLLEEFRRDGYCHTVAKFFMDTFNMSFDTFRAFDKEITSSFNNAEFILTIVNLIAKANIKRLHGSLVILDEYTVIKKPLLLVTLMLLKHYKIGAILCGDKGQLVSNNSDIMGNCTSYDIAKVFSDRSFRLRVNEMDSEYDKIVNYVRGLVSDIWLDDFARSLIAVVFHKQLLKEPKFSDTHVAGSHKVLKDLADHLVSEERHPSRPYFDEEQMACSSPKRFLNYLPLVVGSSYYVDERSEYKKGELLRVEKNKVVLRLNDVEISREPSLNDSVILNEHRDELLDGKQGSIYNFPIYPANFMTVLKSQGRPVSGPLDITFKSMTYRGMYVAISRVKDISQVVSVGIKDPIIHLASCVINFGELVDPEFIITAKLLKKRMVGYELYKTWQDTSSVEVLLRSFFDSKSVELRRNIRDKLVSLVKESWYKFRVNPPEVGGDWTTSPIREILKYKDHWLGLACMKKADRGIWLNEFLARTPALRSLTAPGIEDKNIDKDDCLYEVAKLYNLPKWQCNLTEFISDQAKSKKPPPLTVFRKEIHDIYKYGHEKEITTEWLVESLNYTIREHRKGKGLLRKEYKEDELENEDNESSTEHDDSEEEDESSDDDTDSTLETQNSTKKHCSWKISPMKRNYQDEGEDDMDRKKKKSNPSNFAFL